MSVNHRRFYALVAEQFLHGADVVVRFGPVRREAVPEAMARGSLADTGTLDGGRHFAAHGTLVSMVPTFHARTRIDRRLTRWKDVLALPFLRGVRSHAVERVWKVDGAETECKIFLVQLANYFQMIE